MNKLLLSVCFLFLIAIGQRSYAQCNPEFFTKPGIYPDTSKGLDTAYANKPYSMIMTAVIPKDTFVFNTKMPIDSIGIIKFEGLPEGFTVTANTESGFWKGGTSGCVLISGNPVDSLSGVYPLYIEVLAVVSGLPAPYPVPGFKIVIIGKSSKQDIQKNDNILLSYTDNNITRLTFSSTYSGLGYLELIELSGRILISRHLDIIDGINSYEFNVNDVPSGIYLIKLTQQSHIQISKFVIER